MITLTRSTKMDALRYGRLEIIGTADRHNGHIHMLCRCDCGTEKAISLYSLKKGATQSCGCYRKEKGPGNKRHGLADTKIHMIWMSMRQRCSNSNNPAFKNYGGRGITVDPRWNSFEAFFEDMGEAPKGMSLDRIDNDKGYGPDNCKWATRIEQGRNTRTCHPVTFEGATKTISEWAEEYGIGKSTLSQRIRNGWDIERALNQSPLQYHNRPC